MPRSGHFTDASMLRRVVGHRLTGLSGPRALLVMAAHPLAFQGFFAHTGSLADPYARLRRTATVLDAIAFGSRAEADRLSARVRAMHARVRGELREAAGPFAAGTPYRADDPELLLWILGALADSVLLVYDRYVASLSDGERDQLWRDYRVVGRAFGLQESEMPLDVDDFDAYMAGMYASDAVHVTPQARELALEVVMKPPLPSALWPLREAINQTTVGLLPATLRRQYGLSWDPVRAVALRGGATSLKRVLLPALPRRMALLRQARVGVA